MKFSCIKHKRNTEKVWRERITLINKTDKLSLNEISVYVIVKYNDKFFLYNSRLDKDWVSSDAMLISIIMRIHLHKSHINLRKEKILSDFQTVFLKWYMLMSESN